MSKLIDIETGNTVDVNSETILIIQHGVNRGDKFQLVEIVEPCEQWPTGLLKSKPAGIGWQQYYPHVFGLRIEEDE